MKMKENEEDLLSVYRSGNTWQTRPLFHAGAKPGSKNDSVHTALKVRNNGIKMLCIAAVCVLFGLAAACTPVSDSAETPGLKATDADLIDLTISFGSLLPVFAADTMA
jgi:hypothetical protein